MFSSNVNCRLKDAPKNEQVKPFIVSELEKTIQNLVFFDLRYAQEQKSETSKTNIDEALFIKGLFTSIVNILLASKDIPKNIKSDPEKLDYVG